MAEQVQKTFQRTVSVPHEGRFNPSDEDLASGRKEFSKLAKDEGLTLSDDVKVIGTSTEIGFGSEVTFHASTVQPGNVPPAANTKA